MKPTLITFDAAETLLRVRWAPGPFAITCAREIGLDVGDTEQAEYEGLLRGRWRHYCQLNETRDHAVAAGFWRELTTDWLLRLGLDPTQTEPLLRVADERIYAPDGDLFQLFDDVLPTLNALDAAGIRIGVISNWDYSLHRILRSKGIYERFEFVLASLEEGVEKPAVELFRIAERRASLPPSELAHIGDNPVDDLQGARGAGWRAFLIDRNEEVSEGYRLARLTDLLEAVK